MVDESSPAESNSGNEPAADPFTASAAIAPLSRYILIRWLFLRLMGVVYLIAFLSIGVQIKGLIGEQGILPAREFLQALFDQLGTRCYVLCPTIFWLSASNQALVCVSILGAALSLMVIAGILAQPVLAILWFLYLSIVLVGGDFMSFQWDILLLEVGFLSIFFACPTVFEAPWTVSSRLRRQAQPSMIVIWLLRIVLFKLMFMSGWCKLESHDVTWRHLTALDYHYWTQPLPTPLAWYAAQLPDWFQRLSVLIMFTIELGVPFLIFGPRLCRYVAALLLCSLQLLIAATGNYTFFNLLAVILCLTLLDDDLLKRLVPEKVRSLLLDQKASALTGRAGRTRKVGRAVEISLAVVIALLTLVHFVPALSLVPPVSVVSDLTASLYLVNGYGLFAVMTTSRREIVVEGSDDMQNWRAYEFRFKPGDLKRAPPWVAPYQPRLDWQMWFASLGPSQSSRWFKMFLYRLLKGSPDVLALLQENPFPSTPPKYVRSTFYDYHFSSPAELKEEGRWWHRKYLGLFSGPMTLNEGGVFHGDALPDVDQFMRH